MSLFQCENCGCCENTALAMQGFKDVADWFDWEGIEERKGKLLCSACGPTKDENGDDLPYGKWHDAFDRVFLPLGEFKTNREGNLEHIATGSTDFRQFAINEPVNNSDILLVGESSHLKLAGVLAVGLSLPEGQIPYIIPGHSRCRGTERAIKPLPVRKPEADLAAIKKAQLKRERKNKKRLADAGLV